MDTFFTIFKYLGFGFLGLVALLVAVAVLFGKRIVKQWEFEAKFRDSNGREFGEFDIEMSHVSKEEAVDTFKAEFKMRHQSFDVGQQIQVFLDDVLVLQGPVEIAGRVRLGPEHVETELASAATGQMCRVVYGGVEKFSCAIIPD